MAGKVSVIVPVHNSQSYLESAVASIVSQTYADLEIILVNNGSTDNSLEICKSLSLIDKRIHLIDSDEMGVSRARNRGLEVMSGEFVIFVDSDDWLEVDAIEKAVKVLIDTGSDVVVFSFFKELEGWSRRQSLLPGGSKLYSTDNEKEKLYLKSIYSHYNKITRSDDVSAGVVWGKLYRADVIKSTGLRFNPLLVRAQDVVFSIKAMKYASKIYYIDESLYHYRIHGESTCNSSRYIEDTRAPFDSLVYEFDAFVRNEGGGPELVTALYCRIIQILFWHFDHNYFNKENPINLLQRRKRFLEVVNVDVYNLALREVEVKFLPKQLKVMVFFLRRNLVISFYFFRKVMVLLGR